MVGPQLFLTKRLHILIWKSERDNLKVIWGYKALTWGRWLITLSYHRLHTSWNKKKHLQPYHKELKLKLRKKFLYLKISVSELCIQEIYNPKTYKYVIIYRSIDGKTPLKSFPIWCITYFIICCLTQEKSFNAPLKSEAAIFAIYASEDRWEPHKENTLCWKMTQQKHFWALLLRIFWIFESAAIEVAPPADDRLGLAEARRSTFSGDPREWSGPFALFSHMEVFSHEWECHNMFPNENPFPRGAF